MNNSSDSAPRDRFGRVKVKPSKATVDDLLDPDERAALTADLAAMHHLTHPCWEPR